MQSSSSQSKRDGGKQQSRKKDGSSGSSGWIVTCYTCSKEEHYSLDCPNFNNAFSSKSSSKDSGREKDSKRPEKGSNSQLICYKCRERVHKSPDFPSDKTYQE